MSITLQSCIIPTGIYLSKTYGVVYITYQPDVGPGFLRLLTHHSLGTSEPVSGFNNNSIFTKGLTLLEEIDIPVDSVVSELYPEYFI